MTNIQKRKGFTLMELVSASMIGIIMAGILVGAFSSGIRLQKSYEVDTQLDDLQGAFLRYYLDVGHFPSGDDAVGLAKLFRNTDNQAGWRGPYLSGHPTNFLVDPWRTPLRYRSGQSQQGRIDIALVLSPGRDRRVNSDLNQWNRAGWEPAGDDIARVVSSHPLIPVMEEKTKQILRTVVGRIYTQFPFGAPDNFDASVYRDAWGTPLLYIQCVGFNNMGGVVYSFGNNRSDDNNRGVTICNNSTANRDDLYSTVSYGFQAPVPWEGGVYAEPTQCRAYRVLIDNRYTNQTILVYYQDEYGRYHSAERVAPRSTRLFTHVAPEPFGGEDVLLHLENSTYWLDAFSEKSADLNGDCYVSKIYGFTF